MSEYSASNVWFLSFASGSQSYNYKSNAYSVRAVAALHDETDGESFPVTDEFRIQFEMDMFEASEQCFQGKNCSRQAMEYFPFHKIDVVEIADSIINKTWRPAPLRKFIIDHPTIREIYSSIMPDRIVDTYISHRLEPLMDKVLTNQATACRAGLGTIATVTQAYSAMDKISEHYTESCWCETWDTQSYYMSIDKMLLLNMILSLFDYFWEGDPMEAEICKWIITLRLMKDYAADAIQCSPSEKWIGLNPKKILANQPEGFGIPIGLLLTNESANLYMAVIDDYIINGLGYGDGYGRSIDDCWAIHKDKEKMLHDMPLIREKYAQFNLKIHPKKYYMQHYTKGFKVQNAFIKPGRIHIAKRPVTNCLQKIHWYNEKAKENVTFKREKVETFVSTINSYLGQMKNYDEFNLRREICQAVYEVWKDVLYPDRDNYFKLIVRRRYKQSSRIRRHLKKVKRKFNIDMKSQPVRNFGPAERALPKEKIKEGAWIGRAAITDHTEPETDEQGNVTGTRVIEGMKTWIEMRYDHEPSKSELELLATREC